MTVVYTDLVATGTKGFGNFWKLLFRWKGSIYKLVLPDLAVYIVLYYIINFVYRFSLAERDDDDEDKRMFHLLVSYCSDFSSLIPLQFVMGFYVSQIVTRWWSQFMCIPWPDNCAVVVASGVHGHDERGRMIRRTIMRYVNTTLAMVFTMISPQARARFPTLDHMVEAGLLVPHEKLIIDHLNEKTEGPKYFVPIVWAAAVVARARKEGRIRNDMVLYQLTDLLTRFRKGAGDLLNYDWVCIPLVYTQVVTLCVYVYFLSCLLGKQFLRSKTRDEIDLYVPVFHFLEFFFMMGWLKVAETMVNPFGEDDDDFEVNWLVDRNLTVSYLIVDEMNSEFPEMVRDAYWDDVIPDELPYTEAAMKFKTETFQGSANTSNAPDANNADFVSKRGEASMIGTAVGSQIDHAHAKKGSLGFSVPFSLGQSKPKTEDGNTGAHMFDFAASDRLRKNKQDNVLVRNSVGALDKDKDADQKTYAHLMDRSFVPKKDSANEDGIESPKK